MYPFLNLRRGHLESPSAELAAALTLNWICASHTNCDITTRRRSRSRANYQSSQRKRPPKTSLPARGFSFHYVLNEALRIRPGSEDGELLWSYADVCDTSSTKNTLLYFHPVYCTVFRGDRSRGFGLGKRHVIGGSVWNRLDWAASVPLKWKSNRQSKKKHTDCDGWKRSRKGLNDCFWDLKIAHWKMGLTW